MPCFRFIFKYGLMCLYLIMFYFYCYNFYIRFNCCCKIYQTLLVCDNLLLLIQKRFLICLIIFYLIALFSFFSFKRFLKSLTILSSDCVFWFTWFRSNSIRIVNKRWFMIIFDCVCFKRTRMFSLKPATVLFIDLGIYLINQSY